MVNLTYEEALQIVRNPHTADTELLKIAIAMVEAHESKKGRPKKHLEPKQRPPKHHRPR